jgi:hypothetical protein
MEKNMIFRKMLYKLQLHGNIQLNHILKTLVKKEKDALFLWEDKILLLEIT